MYISFELSILVLVLAVYLFALCLWNFQNRYSVYAVRIIFGCSCYAVFCVHVSSISARSNEKINNHRKMYLLPTFRIEWEVSDIIPRTLNRHFVDSLFYTPGIKSSVREMSNKIFTFLPLYVCAGCFYYCIAMISKLECLFHEMLWLTFLPKKWKEKKTKMLWNVFIPRSAISFNLHFFQQHLNKISKTPTPTTSYRILYQRITIDIIYILYGWCPFLIYPLISPLLTLSLYLQMFSIIIFF